MLEGIIAYGTETRQTSLRIRWLEQSARVLAKERCLGCQSTLEDAWAVLPGCIEASHGLKSLVTQLSHLRARDARTLVELFVDVGQKGQVEPKKAACQRG